MYVVGDYILVEPIKLDEDLESAFHKAGGGNEDMVSLVGKIVCVGNGEAVRATKIKKGDIVHLVNASGHKLNIRSGGKAYYRVTLPAIAFFFHDIKEYLDSVEIEKELLEEVAEKNRENRKLMDEALRKPQILIPDGAIITPN